MTPISIRTEIEEHLSAGRRADALAGLHGLWHQHPTPSSAAFVASCAAHLRPHMSLTAARVFILRSLTLEPAVPLLRAAALLGGIDLTVKVGEFNAWAQEMLDPAGALYTFAPDVAILAVETRTIAPALWEHYADLPAGARQSAIDEAVAAFRDCITAFRKQSAASLIVHGLEVPAIPGQGALDAQGQSGQIAAIHEINAQLRRIAAGFSGVYVLDYDALVARTGRDRWHDEKKWLTVRMPIRAENLPALAAEWMRFLHPITGRIAKVLVTDLDVQQSFCPWKVRNLLFFCIPYNSGTGRKCNVS
jgi:predicted enzyme involved in methoxymalonyl-ACP biosynthesis